MKEALVRLGVDAGTRFAAAEASRIGSGQTRGNGAFPRKHGPLRRKYTISN